MKRSVWDQAWLLLTPKERWMPVAVLGAAISSAFYAIDWIRWTGGIDWRDAAGDYCDAMVWPTVMAVVLWRFLGTASRQ